MLILRIHSSAQLPRNPRINHREFEKYLRKIEREDIPALPKTEQEIHVIFVSASEIQALNSQYRRKDAPTDVLSFFLYDPESPEKTPLFGEIYICLPVAQKQARQRGHSLQQELNILFIHGVLHLLGFDHELDTDFLQMQALEKKILKED